MPSFIASKAYLSGHEPISTYYDQVWVADAYQCMTFAGELPSIS